MRRTVLIVVIAAALALGACASKPKRSEAPAGTGTPGAQSGGAGAASAAGGAEEGAAAPGPLAGILAKRIIYFDFDSSEIKGEGPGIVTAHAKYLAANPTVKVRLEGHTDERGSREYNIGLGERRAQAVRRAMLLQGATEAQLSTVSYGAERPVATGSNEAAWAQNRRVEIVYLK
ncbi:MAG TPA: peptidoglycan-associated lipoprotein Pal [Steroidobacteraceae bacterium]|jgi:peptidoglycan-associated lipoprotein